MCILYSLNTFVISFLTVKFVGSLQKEKDSKLTPKSEETEVQTVPVTGCSTMASPAYSNQPVNSPAYSNPNINSPAYTGQTMNSPAYTNQTVNSPAYSAQTPNTPQTYPNIASPPTPYQYGGGASSHTPTYNAAPSPALPQHTAYTGQTLPSPAAQTHYNTPMPSPARPSATYTPVPSTYNSQQSMQPTQNFMATPPMQQQQQQFPQFPHQSMTHHQMYNQMMSHQQQLMHHHQQRYPSIVNGGYGMTASPYPQHICGHFSSMNMPPSALQLPCPACQNRVSVGDMSYSQGHNNNWPVNGMRINPHYPTQHSYNHMAGVGNQNFNYMSHHFNNVGQMGAAVMNYPQSARDIQCGDVSQSSQPKNKNKVTSNCPTHPVNVSTASNINSKPKAQKEHNNEQISASTNGPTHPTPTETKSQLLPSQQGKSSNKIPDDRIPAENGDSADNKYNYMKQDTYQRTLEYVQQCQNWTTTVVKEEVTSTTDQKPCLNPNGTVADYVPPTGPVSTATTAPSIDTPPTVEFPAVSDVGGGFLSPLSGPIIPNTNMVLNNLSSSLNSLQQETKYLQMLQ